MYPVSLTGETVALREFTEGDAAALHKVYGDPEATRHLSFEARTFVQVENAVGVAVGAARQEPRSEYLLAVTDVASGEVVGVGRLALGEYDSGQIGFALRPDQWGRGRGRETVGLLLRLGFTSLGLHRVWGARSPANEVSARTMESVGMAEEGRIRGHLFTRGAWRDSVVHSILADEYAAAARPAP